MTELPPELDEERPEPEPGFTSDGYRDLVPDEPGDPYRELGGLTRPDSFYGSIEFACPTCLEPKGTKCRIWVERTQRWATRKMPCVTRIRLAKAAGLI